MQCYVHLPGIEAESNSVPFGTGRLERIDFDTCRTLDRAVAEFAKEYERTRPLFWVDEIGSPESADALMESISRRRDDVHAAFLLDSRLPVLPTPALSVTFVRSPAGEIARFIGPAEREWLVHGYPLSVAFDDEQTKRAALRYDRLENRDAWPPGIAAGLSVLEAVSRPDATIGASDDVRATFDFVECVAACEGILLASDEDDQVPNLTDAFGIRGAWLTALDPSERKQRTRDVSEIYRLRSRLIHGQTRVAELTPAHQSLLGEGRRLLRTLVLIGMELRAGELTSSTLGQLAVRAKTDPESEAAVVNAAREVARHG